MTRTMQSVMTKCPHTVGSHQTLQDAKRLMAEFGFRHLPVLKGGRCIGVISDRDIKLAFAVDGKIAASVKVGDACTAEVYTVTPNQSLKEVASHMANEGIGSAVVVENEKVVGIFTTTDACRVLGSEE